MENDSKITIELYREKDADKIMRIMRILYPTPQAEYNKRKRKTQANTQNSESAAESAAAVGVTDTPPSAEPAETPQDSDTLPVVRFVSFENINGAVVHKRLDGTLAEMRAEKRRNQKLKPKWVSPVLDDLGAKLWLNDNMGMFRRDDTNSWKY